MNDIIIFPGDSEGVFFQNELPFIQKYFDNIFVLSYPHSKDKTRNVFDKNNNISEYEVNINLGLLFTKMFWKWLVNDNTQNEIKKHCTFSIKGIKKFFYIVWYGLFYVSAQKIIRRNSLINKKHTVTLYSFWLSRGGGMQRLY